MGCQCYKLCKWLVVVVVVVVVCVFQPGVSPIKKPQVYLTSHILAFTTSHKVEFNKSLYKFPVTSNQLVLTMEVC